MRAQPNTRVSFVEAVARLRAHPCDLAIAMADLGVEPRDWFPTVALSWVEAARAMYPRRFSPDAAAAHRQVQPEKLSAIDGRAGAWSKDARKVVAALLGRSMWGRHGLPRRSLNKVCHGLANVDRAIRELERGDILLHHSKGDTVSLDPAAKIRIEAMQAKLLR